MVAPKKSLSISPLPEDLAADDTREEGLGHERVIEAHGFFVVNATLWHAIHARSTSPSKVGTSGIQVRACGRIVFAQRVVEGVGGRNGVQMTPCIHQSSFLQDVGESVAFVDSESRLSEKVGWGGRGRGKFPVRGRELHKQ